MDVEGNLLGVGAPMLVAEAVQVPAVLLGREGVIAAGNGSGLELVLQIGTNNLRRRKARLAWPIETLDSAEQSFASRETGYG